MFALSLAISIFVSGTPATIFFAYLVGVRSPVGSIFRFHPFRVRSFPSSALLANMRLVFLVPNYLTFCRTCLALVVASGRFRSIIVEVIAGLMDTALATEKRL